jgi:hypothetical protein
LNIILTKLGDANGLESLKKKWETCDKINSSDVKGVSTEEFNNIVEELTYSVKVRFSSDLFALANFEETSTETYPSWTSERRNYF